MSSLNPCILIVDARFFFFRYHNSKKEALTKPELSKVAAHWSVKRLTLTGASSMGYLSALLLVWASYDTT